MTLADPLSLEITLPAQQTHSGKMFPITLGCPKPDCEMEKVAAWIGKERSRLDQLAREYGVVLFRGFPVRSAYDFDAFIRAFQFPPFRYSESLSNAVRKNCTELVFTANEAPGDVDIPLHHEMAQTPVFPGKLFFYCEIAAEEGGQTPVCRSDALFAKILERLPAFAKACGEKGLKYTNVMPSENDLASGLGRSWKDTFSVEDKAGAVARMTKLGYSWEWMEDGSLRATTPVLPAVKELPDGRKVFFNQLIAAFKGWKDARNDPEKAITFGDGSALGKENVQEITDLAEGLAFDVPWLAGDVALVDNYVAMHGRRTFKGKRCVLASLVAS